MCTFDTNERLSMYLFSLSVYSSSCLLVFVHGSSGGGVASHCLSQEPVWWRVLSVVLEDKHAMFSVGGETKTEREGSVVSVVRCRS